MGNIFGCRKKIYIGDLQEGVVLSKRRKVNQDKYTWQGVMADTSSVVFAKQVYNLDTMFFAEVAALKCLEHPYIVTYHGHAKYGLNKFIVMEFIEGKDLFDMVVDREVFDIPLIFEQVIDALYYMQSTWKMSHGDISPENIMIQGGRTAKLIDFEDACIGEEEIEITFPYGKTMYMAPEVKNLENPINVFQADIWSLGTTMLFCGYSKGHLLKIPVRSKRPTLESLYKPAQEDAHE